VEEILSAQAQPARRREIVNKLQNLVSELTQPPNRPVSSNERRAGASEVLAPASDRYLYFGNLVLDRHTQQVNQAGRSFHLAPTTFEYLVSLVLHSPDPVECETLVKEAQGYNLTRIEAREMAVWHIHELRKTLEPDPQNPQFILTIRNIGYRILA
jgi:DNA-binding response OmpR family regulator